jgi:Family of unknown function (DUF5972)
MRFECYSPVTQSIERASRLGGQVTDFRRLTMEKTYEMKKTYEKPALVKAGSFRKLTGLGGTSKHDGFFDFRGLL